MEEDEDEDAPSKSTNATLGRKVCLFVHTQFYLAYVVVSVSAIQFIISLKRTLSELMERQVKVPGTSSAVMGIERF